MEETKTLINKLFGLWESLAESGELKSSREFGENYREMRRQVKKYNDIQNVSGTPSARVKHWNDETEEVEYGTLKETRLHVYLVVPDNNLTTIVKWDKIHCDVQV